MATGQFSDWYRKDDMANQVYVELAHRGSTNEIATAQVNLCVEFLLNN